MCQGEVDERQKAYVSMAYSSPEAGHYRADSVLFQDVLELGKSSRQKVSSS